MKRLVKKSEIYNATTQYGKYCECFKNPTAKEWDSLLNAFSIRFVILEDGTVYIWDGEILHNEAEKKFNIPINYIRGMIEGKRNMHISLMPNTSFKVLKDGFSKATSLLNFVPNNISIYFYSDYEIDDEPFSYKISTLDDILNYKEKTAKLKTAEFFNGVNNNDNYYECFKNPNANEWQEILKSNNSARAILHKNGDLYIWDTNFLHHLAIRNFGIKDGIHLEIENGEVRIYLTSSCDLNYVISAFTNANALYNYLNPNTTIKYFDYVMYGAPKEDIYKTFKTINDIINYGNQKVGKLITSEIYNGINFQNNYYECFKNPTAKEAKSFWYIRGIATENGDVYIWDGEILHDKGIPLFDIPQNYIRFTFADDEVKISLTPNVDFKMLQTVFTNCKSLYNFIGQNAYVDFYTDFRFDVKEFKNKFHKITDILNYDEQKTAKLITSEIYDGMNYEDEYFEVYKNPTASEIKAIKQVDPNDAVRGVIDPSGVIYMWPAEVDHYSINKYVSVPVNHFRFVYEEKNSTCWIFDLQSLGGNLTVDEAIEIIKNNLSTLELVGNLNKSFSIIANGSNDYLGGPNLNKMLQSYTPKVAKLVKKSELFNAFKRKNEFTDDYDYEEIFKNPNSIEIKSIKNENNGNIRGVILDNGDIYIWNGYILHPSINHNIDISQFRFAYEPGCWLIDAHNKYTLKDIIQIIESHKPQLSQIGNFEEGWDIVYCKDSDPPVATLEEIKKMLGENNDEEVS